MKEFDLEAAKAGKPVCTRDGRKARILAFDLVDKEYPIVAAITGKNGTEELETFTAKGRYDTFSDDVDGPDLMMQTEKKQGWINVYRIMNEVMSNGDIYKTEELAKNDVSIEDKDYIGTFPFQWEE